MADPLSMVPRMPFGGLALGLYAAVGGAAIAGKYAIGGLAIAPHTISGAGSDPELLGKLQEWLGVLRAGFPTEGR